MRGPVAGEHQEGAPRGGGAPTAVGGVKDGVEVRFERDTAVLRQCGIGDCAREVGFGRGVEGGWSPDGRGELAVKGEKVCVTVGDGEGTEREAKLYVVDGVRLAGGGGEGGIWNGDLDGRHCGLWARGECIVL